MSAIEHLRRWYQSKRNASVELSLTQTERVQNGRYSVDLVYILVFGVSYPNVTDVLGDERHEVNFTDNKYSK